MEKNHISQYVTNCVTKLFGVLPNGKEVHSYTLVNSNGMEVTFINYGATITSITLTAANGQRTDVALGFDSIEDYINAFSLPSAPYFGSVIGRYAGRIANGVFTLNDKEYHLEKNNGNNTLHGGAAGFGRAFWVMKRFNGGESPSITFAYTSRDGEENFPGELAVEVTYTLTDDNELIVAYTAITTKDTVVNLTQHTYFNLEGHTETVTDQEVFVNSYKILEVLPDGTPTGNMLDVSNSPFNFTVPGKVPYSIDNSFVLNDKAVPAATLYSKKTGLGMAVYTNQPSVHIYVGGNCFGKVPGKDGAAYHTTSGICFETQNYPDAPNIPHFPNAVLKPGETYNHITSFKFTHNEE